MNLRKTALTAAAAMILAPVTALPAYAADTTPTPTATTTTAPGDTPLIELVLQCFPDPVQADARLVVGGDWSQLGTLLQDLLHLTPNQLTTILANLQGLAGVILPTTSPTPTPTTSTATTTATALTADQAAELQSLLAQIKGKLTAAKAGYLILTVGSS